MGIAFVDKDYPARAAFGIVTKVQDDFSDQSRDAWRTATADNADAVPLLEAAVAKYQVQTHVQPASCMTPSVVWPAPESWCANTFRSA